MTSAPTPELSIKKEHNVSIVPSMKNPFRIEENESSENPFWLGVEIECVRRNRATDIHVSNVIIKLNTDFLIARYDGSLPGNGIEFVSVPATLKYHSKVWPNLLPEMVKYVSAWPHHECGMHVHLSRSQINREALGKIMVFINKPANSNFITEMAGRHSNDYCYRTVFSKKEIDALSNNGYTRGYTGHFAAISISGHTDRTIECRIFRSNLKVEGFLKNLEFAHSLKFFANAVSAEELNGKVFLKWVFANKSQYPNLFSWIDKRTKGKSVISTLLSD